MTKMHMILGLIGWIAICFAVAAVAGRYMPGEWYAGLNKPSWNPPSWVFGPVWTILYTTMGLAAWLVWKQHGFKGAGPALGLFLFQLVLNGLWTWIFFGLHRPALAFAEIVTLWLAIVATIIAFWPKNMAAGILLIPYAAWVAFASLLNFNLWRLNR